MRQLFAAVGTVGLAVGIAFGEPAPTPAIPPAVAEDVAKLGSEDFREREAAVAALEKAGAAAIPALRAARESSDAEVRQRAAAILHKLQRAAESSSKLTPKTVALNYKDTPLGTAVNDLKARTGLNIRLDPDRIADPLRKVTCATTELPAWAALDAFCAAAGLKEDFRQDLEVPKVQITGRRGYLPPPQVPGPDAVPITLADGKAQRFPGDRRTAVRVLVLPPSFPGHRVTLGTGDTSLCFDITPAPGLNWQEVTAVKITKLIDDAGRFGGAGSVKPSASDSSDSDAVVVWGGQAGGFGRGRVAFGGQFDPRTGMPLYPDSVPNPRIVAVPLKLSTPTARSLKRLEGLVLGEITLQNQPLVTVTDPTKHTGGAFDGAGQTRLIVGEVREIKDAMSLEVVLQSPSPWAVSARRGWNPGGIWPESPRSANELPSVQAFDTAGNRIARVTMAHSNSSDDGQLLIQHFTLVYQKDAPPAKITAAGPRPMIVEVPFVMENVPLP